MFGSIPISLCKRLKSVVIFSQNWTEIISTVDKK